MLIRMDFTVIILMVLQKELNLTTLLISSYNII